MSNTITGDEPVNAVNIERNARDCNGDKIGQDTFYPGETIYGKTLREFMLGIISNNDWSISLEDADFVEDIYGKYIKTGDRYSIAHAGNSTETKRFTLITTAFERIAREAHDLTTAYLNQLNKQL